MWPVLVVFGSVSSEGSWRKKMEEEDIEEDDEDRIAIYPISPPTTIMSGGLIRIISGVKLVFQSYDFLRFAVLSGWCTEAIFTTAKCTVQINDVIAHCFYCCDARLAFNPSIGAYRRGSYAGFGFYPRFYGMFDSRFPRLEAACPVQDTGTCLFVCLYSDHLYTLPHFGAMARITSLRQLALASCWVKSVVCCTCILCLLLWRQLHGAFCNHKTNEVVLPLRIDFRAIKFCYGTASVCI